ncbi:MAG: DUF2190 family protein [Porticoccaceae bacterium]|nr:DUF2190 family protein [Porticoccaceae bacterium]
MAKNFVAKGDAVTVVAAATVTSGSGVLLGNLFGVALSGADNGEELVLQLAGVFDLPAATADAITVGSVLYWDDSAKAVTTDADSGSNQPVGLALSAKAGSTAGNVHVRLSGNTAVTVAGGG